MSAAKLFIVFSIFLFGSILTVAAFKKFFLQEPEPSSPIVYTLPNETYTQNIQHLPIVDYQLPPTEKNAAIELPFVDRIEELFYKNNYQLPLVETITYKSHVPWLKGRPAWLSDYASYYQTSRHFIARSLNNKPDYFKQEISEGDKFNVLRKNVTFEILVDTSRCLLWLFGINTDTQQKILLKTYRVGLGRIDSLSSSGLLTPLGTYLLGDRVAIYKPKTKGIYHNKSVEMITIFGTRWIPFEKEIGSCTAPAKGFGIHGTPWLPNDKGEIADCTTSIGEYKSDGCIHLATPDMEEIFALVITKPTTIKIVSDASSELRGF